jgi:hypothetical protein
MTDLRAAVEGLEPPERDWPWESTVNYNLGWDAALTAVLALIPEGAVLVTEGGLARALHEQYDIALCVTPEGDHEMRPDWWTKSAAAILCHLRETP